METEMGIYITLIRRRRCYYSIILTIRARVRTVSADTSLVLCSCFTYSRLALTLTLLSSLVLCSPFLSLLTSTSPRADPRISSRGLFSTASYSLSTLVLLSSVMQMVPLLLLLSMELLVSQS